MTLPPREGVGQFSEPRELVPLHEGRGLPKKTPTEQVKRT